MPARKQQLPEGMLAAGRITGCHGVRGWVKVQPFTEIAGNLLRFPAWWLQARDGHSPVVIDDGRVLGKGLVVHITGVDDRDSAARLRGQTLLVRADALPELGSNEFYWHQLENLRVWCRDCSDAGDVGEKLLGRVHYLIETGANDVLVVRPCEDSIDDRERLIPYIEKSVVHEVDLDNDRIAVSWYLDA